MVSFYFYLDLHTFQCIEFELKSKYIPVVSQKPEMDDEVGDDVTVETVDESEINGAGNSILAKMMVVKLHAIV